MASTKISKAIDATKKRFICLKEGPAIKDKRCSKCHQSMEVGLVNQRIKHTCVNCSGECKGYVYCQWDEPHMMELLESKLASLEEQKKEEDSKVAKLQVHSMLCRECYVLYNVMI